MAVREGRKRRVRAAPKEKETPVFDAEHESSCCARCLHWESVDGDTGRCRRRPDIDRLWKFASCVWFADR